MYSLGRKMTLFGLILVPWGAILEPNVPQRGGMFFFRPAPFLAHVRWSPFGRQSGPKGPPRVAQGPQKAPQRRPRDPKRHPEAAPGTPKDTPRLPQRSNVIVLLQKNWKMLSDWPFFPEISENSYFRLHAKTLPITCQSKRMPGGMRVAIE